jgi:hypothetical protein
MVCPQWSFAIGRTTYETRVARRPGYLGQLIDLVNLLAFIRGPQLDENCRMISNASAVPRHGHAENAPVRR